MLKIKSDIILRESGDGAFLFNPDNGKLFRLNRSGRFLWECLAAGLGKAQIVEKIQEFPGVPDRPDLVVDVFLAELSRRRFVEGYAGSAPSPGVVAPEIPEDRAMYEMNSMLRVFSPGDALVLRDIPFAEIRVGDVAAFYPDGFDVPGVVHRVIRRTDCELVTMGDNNACPDARRVTKKDLPRLVIAKISPDNVRTAVPGGAAGMRRFRLNRMRRIFRRCCGKVCRVLMPLMVWRIDLSEDENGKYYYGRRPIAERNGNAVYFFSFVSRFRFRIVPESIEKRGVNL